jgi:Na+-translocating ferredoxin:NAD+ oxidoreductase RnfC subunit
MGKLGVKEYDVPAHYQEKKFSPKKVRIPLSQHIGTGATPVVKLRSEVKAGDVIGEIPEGKLGARIHASISGVVTAITDEIVIEQK